jgi:hypothetical protein
MPIFEATPGKFYNYWRTWPLRAISFTYGDVTSAIIKARVAPRYVTANKSI